MTRHIAKIMFSVLPARILFSVLLAAQTSPEAFLGFKIGADRKLADCTRVQAYFQKLAQESLDVPPAPAEKKKGQPL
jgi:hypothetical protein